MEGPVEPLAAQGAGEHLDSVVLRWRRDRRVFFVVGAAIGLALSVLAIRNPARFAVVDEYPLVGAMAMPSSAVVLGGAVWVTSRRWWWRLLAGGFVVVGLLSLVVLVGVLVVFLNAGRPLEELALRGRSGGHVVVQTMQTGIGPDSSCVRIDVRASDRPFTSHRFSKCVPQIFDVDGRLDASGRLVLDLGGEGECTFDVDWSSQRLATASQQQRCLAFLD